MNPVIQFINTDDALEKYCASIQAEKVLAIDTEFVREKTYYPKLCLIQVATAQSLVCIDPLAIKQLKPLLDIIYNDDIVKVLHACSQDLEIFYYLNGKLPQNIFDTQIAASLLGFGEQLGYANLMQKILNVEIDKGQSRTNWEQRPLHDKQIHYAANDVLYLLQAYPIIRQQVADQNRLEWLTQNTQRLCQTSTYENNVNDVWQRVKHCNKLRGKQLAVLQALARWREEKAINKNLPRKWIVSDDILFDLSRIQPDNTKDLENIRGIEKYENRFDTFFKLIKTGQELPKSEWPTPKNTIRLSPEQSALLDIITAIIKLKAEEHQISQSNIATRKELEKLVTGNRDIKLLKETWLYDMAGKAIVDFIEGRVSISVSNNNQIEFKQH